MKRILTALVALTAIIFVSCSSDNTKVVNPQSHEFVFTATCDTAIVVNIPVTGPINLCAGGQSPYRKIVSYKDSTIYLKKNQTIMLSSEYMNGQGWYWFPKGVTPVLPDNTTTSNASNSGSSGNYGFPDWMKWVFWNLLLPILIGLLFYWIITEILRAMNRPGNPSGITGQHSGTASTSSSNSPTSAQQPVSHEVNMETTVVNDFGNQQRPLFVVENSGQGSITVGNIHIHIDSDGDQNSNQPEKKPATEEAK